MSAQKKVATYDEALQILTDLARGGDVRAAVALAGHLRKESHGDEDQKPERSKIVELASKRAARTG